LVVGILSYQSYLVKCGLVALVYYLLETGYQHNSRKKIEPRTIVIV